MKKRINFKEIIIYEDNDYIIINKPAFISSLEDRNDHLNILKLARSYWPGARVCHRLDKDTTGCLVIAKNNEAYKNMAMQLQNREVIKTYHAVVDGLHNFDQDKIQAPLISGAGNARVDYKKGKKAETEFRVIKKYRAHTLVACVPLSGRLHQIRVHLAFLKAPVSGDVKYGGKPFYLSSIKKNYRFSTRKDERQLIRRYALHAFAITFTDMHGKKVSCEAPYPDDYRILLSKLDKFGR